MFLFLHVCNSDNSRKGRPISRPINRHINRPIKRQNSWPIVNSRPYYYQRSWHSRPTVHGLLTSKVHGLSDDSPTTVHGLSSDFQQFRQSMVCRRSVGRQSMDFAHEQSMDCRPTVHGLLMRLSSDSRTTVHGLLMSSP